MTEPSDFPRELAERYYLAYCERYHLDPDEQSSARAFEEWFNTTHEGMEN